MPAYSDSSDYSVWTDEIARIKRSTVHTRINSQVRVASATTVFYLVQLLKRCCLDLRFGSGALLCRVVAVPSIGYLLVYFPK